MSKSIPGLISLFALSPMAASASTVPAIAADVLRAVGPPQLVDHTLSIVPEPTTGLLLGLGLVGLAVIRRLKR